MKKKSIRKLIAISACASVLFLAGGTFAACDDVILEPGIEFVEEVKKEGPQFLEGALTELTVGDTLVLKDYIEYVTDGKYTITLTNEAGEESDLTTKKIWKAQEAGTYTITYAVKSGKSKGTNTFTFTVKYPELKWEFKLQNKPYLVGETLNLEAYLAGLKIYVYDRPEEHYTIQVESVTVDDEEISLLGEEEYTFTSMSDHTFKFSATTIDGQRIEGREVIFMKSVDKAYAQELADMGITYSGELYVERDNYTMMEGMYANGRNAWLRRSNGPHNVPYLAYNGNYGIGDFVKIDFTGKNMPTLSFFRDDDYSKSMFDGTKGIVYTGGFTNNFGGAIHSEKNNDVTLYGPYMMNEYDRGAEDTTTIADSPAPPSADNDVCPGSFNSLVDGTRYRMIAGFTGIEKGTAGLLNSNPTEYVETLFLTFQCVILNLDTSEVFAEIKMRTYGIQALRFQEIPLDTENNSFFTGNIVLYGQHGRRTTFDEVYPIVQGKTFEEVVKEEAPQATFKETAKSFVMVNTDINVSDYVDTTKANYSFFYRDEAGVDYPITGNTFKIDKVGRYSLFYKHSEYYYGVFEIFVGDLQYKATVDESGKIVLDKGSIGNGGSYTGPNANNLIDQAYVAFTGEYSFDDYVVLDFTGKNMPEIAFFAEDFDNSMYAGKGGKHGVVVASGITLWDGSTSSWVCNNGTQVGVSGPYMANLNAAAKDASGNLLNAFNSKLARENLQDGVRYRVIMGFAEATDSRAIVLKYALYNLDTNTLVEEVSQVSWNMFSNPDFYAQDRSTLVGSIVLYGKFQATTTVDKFWGIYEDTTIADICTQLGMKK